MNKIPEIFERREAYCKGKLATLREKVSKIDNLSNMPDLCIYVTGSYGRSEASEFSDLDLFFIKNSSYDHPIRRTDKILMDADLIRITRDMKLPEFSGYGEYLEIHYICSILKELGSRSDDYDNLFTARLLLILESQPVYNDETYKKIVSSIVGTYFRDYHDHEKSFMPIFLVNDIIRFWKTLCLNYEHKRNRSSDVPLKKNDAHLRNLKLKFSRMLTCYSLIATLCHPGIGKAQGDIESLGHLEQWQFSADIVF